MRSFGLVLVAGLVLSAASPSYGAEKELRLMAGMGTRINQAAGRPSAAVFSERVEAGYSFRDWFELSASAGYTGLYLVPTAVTKAGALTQTTVSNAHLFEVLVGPNFRAGMKNIVSFGLKLGPQLGTYVPRYIAISPAVHDAPQGAQSTFAVGLLGVAQGSVERRIGEHWIVGLRGSVERSLWMPTSKMKVTSGSLEATVSYAFFPGT